MIGVTLNFTYNCCSTGRDIQSNPGWYSRLDIPDESLDAE